MVIRESFVFVEEIVEQDSEFLSLATKESYITFNGKLYKQADGVAMGL